MSTIDISTKNNASQVEKYAARFSEILLAQDWSQVNVLISLMRKAWAEDRMVFVCGNGGSAANALHWATDFIYPVAPGKRGMRIMALPANPGVISCLGNDISYASIFAQQLRSIAKKGDLVILLSGSGNSPNILEAIEVSRHMGLTTVGMFGFGGGKALPLVDVPIHFAIDDMQIAEDLQLVVNHMVMKTLLEENSEK